MYVPLFKTKTLITGNFELNKSGQVHFHGIIICYEERLDDYDLHAYRKSINQHFNTVILGSYASRAMNNFVFVDLPEASDYCDKDLDMSRKYFKTYLNMIETVKESYLPIEINIPNEPIKKIVTKHVELSDLPEVKHSEKK